MVYGYLGIQEKTNLPRVLNYTQQFQTKFYSHNFNSQTVYLAFAVKSKGSATSLFL